MKRFVSPKDALQSVLSPNEKLRYQPLSRPEEIRPVKVFPGSRISPVKCELQSAILGPESPKYIVFSYCWGDVTHKTWVSCSGHRLALTVDLLNATRRLRRRNDTETLWIDQIWVNQEDLEECSSQVQFMQRIHNGAANVSVLLGDGADESKLAFVLMSRLSRAFGIEVGSWLAGNRLCEGL